MADPVQVWPILAPPDGLSVAESPAAPPEIAGFQDRVDRARKAGTIDLIFDGDSITDFWQSTGKAVWKEHYGQVKAFDFGVSGEQTQNLLWRIDHGQLEGLHPKLVVLMIGTNNLGRDPDEVPDGIKLIVDTYRKDCPEAHILLLGIFPRSQLPTDPVRALIKKINEAIAKFADDHVAFLDIGDKFLQPDGTLTSDIMPDFIHPSEKGYRIWADAIQPIVDQYCPKSNEPPVVYHEPTLQWPFPLHPPAGEKASTFPIPTAGWFSRYQGNIDRLKKPADLIFDGDEAMEGWQDQARGYPILKERYAPLHLANIGIGNDQVQNVLWRTQQGELDGVNPKLVVLMAGANNSGQDPAGVAKGIKLILNEYGTRCPQAHILLLGIFPRDLSPKSASRAWITRVNQILATYDDGKRVTFLDVGPKFLLPDGTMNPDLMADYLHLTAKGYVVWADAMQPVIDQYVPKG